MKRLSLLGVAILALSCASDSKKSEAPRPAPIAVDPLTAKITELKLKNTPTTIHNGMELIERLHADEKLEAWAKGENIDPALVLDFTARLSNVLDRVEWKAAKKRERNPTDYDRIVAACITGTKSLHGLTGNPEAFKKAADTLMQSCVDCHTLYR